jgi:hypothetical protein
MKALPYEKGTEHNHETDEKLHLEILLPPIQRYLPSANGAIDKTLFKFMLNGMLRL